MDTGRSHPENIVCRITAPQQKFTISLGTNESRLHLDQAYRRAPKAKLIRKAALINPLYLRKLSTLSVIL